MTSGELSCKEFVELVTDYLERALPPEEVTRFEAHLELCNGCAVYLDQMALTMRWVGKLTEEDVSEEARDRLLKIFREWKNNN
jgi:hypothetical protein